MASSRKEDGEREGHLNSNGYCGIFRPPFRDADVCSSTCSMYVFVGVSLFC